MFIPKKAFNVINILPNKSRNYYESLFGSLNIPFANVRIKGVINDSISERDTIIEMKRFYEYLKNMNFLKEQKTLKIQLFSPFYLYLFSVSRYFIIPKMNL